MSEPKTTLTDGSPVPKDGSHRNLRADDQQAHYVVLSAEERAKGFVRPVRRTYRHVGQHVCGKPSLQHTTGKGEFWVCVLEPGHEGECTQWQNAGSDEAAKRAAQHVLGGCNCTTTMGQALAETYARDPHFYGATFCVSCGTHFPVGKRGEFVWEGTAERVGS